MTAMTATNLPTLLRERAREIGDVVFAEDIEDRRLTYREAVAWMDRRAAAWRAIGVAAGDHVVTMGFNTFESLAGWLGLAAIGAIEAPINTDYRGELLTHALNITRARTMVLNGQFVGRVAEIAEDLLHLERLIVIDDGASWPALPFAMMTEAEFLAGAARTAETIDPQLWDIAAILFTSGTTGPSKAVRMPWAQLRATATASLPLADLGPGDVIFNPGPTYHLGAKCFPFQAALIGARHVMRPFISLSRQPDEYRKHGVTTVFYPPLQWLDEPARPDDADCALRNLLLPLPIPRIDEFTRRFGCRTYSVYSMTELSCPIADVDWDIGKTDAEGLFSCGVVRAGHPGYEARIVDEWDQEVAPGVVGELIVRAAVPWTVNAGYLNNPEATAAAWRNGWFHTGDAFSRDADGHFYFRDRIKDCIRRRGENISSFEVESYVRKHPAVIDCAAVAEKLADEAGADEEIRLFVVPKAEADLDPETLARWLIGKMPRFMVPRFIEFVDALPQTPNLKVQKAVLRARPRSATAWDRERAGVEVPR